MGRKTVIVLAVLLGLFIVGGLVVNFYPVADFASEAINDASKSAPPRAIEPARESNRDIYPPLPNSYPDEASQDSIDQGSTPYGEASEIPSSEAKDLVNEELDSKDEAKKDRVIDKSKIDEAAKFGTNKSVPVDSPSVPDKAANEEAMHRSASESSQNESATITDKTTNSCLLYTSDAADDYLTV